MTGNGLATAAYGLRISGLGDEETLSVLGEPAWPAVHVSHGVGEQTDEPKNLGDRHSLFQLIDTELRLDRERREAVFTTTRPFSVEEIVHPYLAPVANVFARWDGCETLHAGAVVAGGGAWVLLGDKQAGKSTTLAWLATHGQEVLADDIVVLHGLSACAGPRCLDVRDDVSERMDVGAPAVAPEREGGRNRVKLPPITAEVPLRGFVYLEWGDAVAVERIGPSERIARLQPQRQAVRLFNDPVVQLDLATRPALVLRRPRGLESLDAAGETLLAALPG